MHAQGNTQVLKRPEKAKFTSQDELSTEIPYSNKTKQKSLSNPGEVGKSNFQSYHLKKLKCPVFKIATRSQGIKKKTGKYGPLKGMNRKLP